ncbi:hypothetical protein [Alkalihalobacterium alkalinitrilicum]|uniref:hypothetical protein n=1 Tax=Alkalihalobacterium alkalinitrilicum TaxID=427920 RepID=UPI000995AF3E|nr:hypothetical protein [Alkalihalobacterium alkalinitrilicum]
MTEEQLTLHLNAIGKGVFVSNFYSFKRMNIHKATNSEVAFLINEEFTLKSKQSRTAKARKFFENNMEIEALKVFISTNNRTIFSLREKAMEILAQELINSQNT